MKLYLIYFKLDNYLSEDILVIYVGNIDVFILVSVEVKINGDYMCKELVLGRVIDFFYSLYY